MSAQRKDKCIVTLLIGDYYQALWEKLFADTWYRYAEKHGYDIITIKDYIDPDHAEKKRSPHWQKCLILEHPEVKQYKRAVWIDSDILINYHRAPCIVSQTDEPGKVGAVSYAAFNTPTPKLRANRQDRHFEYSVKFGGGDAYGLGRAPEPRDIYRAIGFDTTIDDVVNTGVLVFDTDTHAGVLRDVYETHKESRLSLFENIPLSMELLRRGLVQFIDPRFNADYLYELLESYPFLLLKEFQEEKKENRRLRILSANVIWNNNFFLHCVSGAPTSREDILWIFRNVSDWNNYLFNFRE